MSMDTTPTHAAIYCRISKDIAGTGLGVERQEALCQNLAREKGWKVAQVYTDNDLSAFNGQGRPAYERMVSDLESGTIDAVLVVDQDRLTRHPMQLEGFITLADRLGVPLANVSGDIDLASSDGRFRARILGAVARQESEKKSERLRRQKDQAASKGWAQGGRRRYGYRHARAEDGSATLQVIPEEAEIVRETASRFLSGESLRQIALNLNARGVPTATGGDARWRVTTLRTMLGGPHISGLRVHHGEIVGEGNWEPILDRTTWEQIRAILGDPRRQRGGRPAVHLLTGLLMCSLCGGSLRHSPRPAPSGRYSCDPPPGGCAKIAISASRVEEMIEAAVLEALDSPQMATALREADTPDLDGIIRQIEQAEASLDELARHYYTEHHISEREFIVARNALDARITDLRGQLAQRPVTGRLGASGRDLRGLWDDADTTTRRQIIAEVIDHVVVSPGVQGRRFVDPGRLQIIWRA